MFKKILVTFLCLTVILGIVPVIANAEEHTHNWEYHFEYNFLGIYSELYKECSVCSEKESVKIAEPNEFVGDVNIDDKIDVVDYVMIKRQVLRTYDLGGRSILADVNLDGTVDVADYVMVKRHVVGSYNIFDQFWTAYDKAKEQYIKDHPADPGPGDEPTPPPVVEDNIFVIEIRDDGDYVIVDTKEIAKIAGVTVEQFLSAINNIKNSGHGVTYGIGLEIKNYMSFANGAEIDNPDLDTQLVAVFDYDRIRKFYDEGKFEDIMAKIYIYVNDNDEDEDVIFKEVSTSVSNITFKDLRSK